MTDLGHTQVAVSPFLTETANCPGQIQQGNLPTNDEVWDTMVQDLLKQYAPFTYDEMVRWLRYEHYDRYRRPGQKFLDELPEYSDYCALRDKRHTYLEAKYQEWKRKPKVQVHAGHELGAREFTLTYSPKWFDDAEARRLMVKAIDKLCKYYKDEIVELRAIGEVGSNGLSHVHCFYKLKEGRKITDKNFKRAWEYWNPKKPIGKGRHRGFEGGHHANVRNESDFRGYIDKDVDVTSWYEKNVDIEHNHASPVSS